MDALRSTKGMRVPEDILVAGFDDLPAAAWASFDLTTVVHDAPSMVERSIDLLQAAIAKPDESRGSRLIVPAALVIRGSMQRPT